MKLFFPLLALATLTAIAPLDADTLPRWKFPAGTGLDYEIEQYTTIESEDGGTSITNAEGTIQIAANKGAALLHLQLRITESTIRGEVIEPEDIAELPPTEYRVVLSPDGTLASGATNDPTNLQLLLDLTFPLPDKFFSVGNPITEKISMQSSGKLADLEGDATYTHRGYKMIDGVKYLAFTVECKLESGPGLPPAPFAPDPPTTSIDAKIECLFDEKAGYFYNVKNAMSINASMSSPKNSSHRHTLAQTQIITVQIVPSSKGG